MSVRTRHIMIADANSRVFCRRQNKIVVLTPQFYKNVCGHCLFYRGTVNDKGVECAFYDGTTRDAETYRVPELAEKELKVDE